MTIRQLNDETRRHIGDLLLATNDKTAPIKNIAECAGLTRQTLTRWIEDNEKFWQLTRHIPDNALTSYRGRRYYSRDSRFFDHAQRHAENLRALRADALAGVLGERLKKMERERKRDERR